MKKIVLSSILFLLVLAQVPVSQAQTIPIIDGIVEEEWDDAAKFSIEMTNGKVVDLRFFYTDTDMYILVVIDHSSAENTVNFNTSDIHDYFGIEFDLNGDGVIMGTSRSPDDLIIVDYNEPGYKDMYILVVIDHSSAENTINFNTSDIHDYFGIEFDLNGDGVIMGTSRSPDDLIIVDYNEPGYKDMYMHSFKAFDDVKNEGSNDGEGASGTDGKNLIWEFRKPLNSGDTLGYDISLKKGDKFQIMLAFWDDKYPNTAAGYTNTFSNNQQFLTFIVGELKQSFFANLIGVFIIVPAYLGTNYIAKNKKNVQI